MVVFQTCYLREIIPMENLKIEEIEKLLLITVINKYKIKIKEHPRTNCASFF